jgi:hypothetical protein
VRSIIRCENDKKISIRASNSIDRMAIQMDGNYFPYTLDVEEEFVRTLTELMSLRENNITI